MSQWAAETGDPTTSQVLASAYNLVADKLDEGRLDVDRSFDALADAADTVTRAQRNRDTWDPVRQKITELAASKEQRSELSTASQYAQFYRQVAAGLEGWTQTAGILDRIDRDRLKVLLDLVLQIILAFLV